MGKDKESLWETLQRAAIKIIEVPHRKIETSEMSEITLRYARWFDRKSASMPGPMKILQRRTLGTALQVIENVYDIPFEKMTTANYFFCKDIRTEKFTRLYESQIDLAGMAPDDFVRGLHKFFNYAGRMILEEGLQREFAEFLSLSFMVSDEIRANEGSQSERSRVSTAYVCLLLQQTQYMKSEKFYFDRCVCGISSSGEYLEIPDIYPLSDVYSAAADDRAMKLMQQGKPVDPIALVAEEYGKHGIKITSLQDLEHLQNIDKTFVSTMGVMMPYINEYTYDILPQPEEAFQCNVLPYYYIKFNEQYDIPTLRDMLNRRARTLSANGVKISIKDSENDFFAWKDILMKETFHSDAIVMLYKLCTVTGCFCGFYNTKTQEFYSPLQSGQDVDGQLLESVERLVLFLYASAVTRQGVEMLQNISKYTYFDIEGRFAIDAFEAEIFYMGGKLRSAYGKEESTKYRPTGPRAGNEEKYEAKTSAIQGFIRKVGEGRTPSPEAIERAEALGFDLAPDETYVQPFLRTSWKLKRKPVDEAKK